MRLKARNPFTYANRRLAEGDIFTPESSAHARLLVLAGRATLVDDEPAKEPEIGPILTRDEENTSPPGPQSTPDPVQPAKRRRGRPRKNKSTPNG